MNCESCGQENLEGAHFCAGCGVQLASKSRDEKGWIGRLIGGRFRVKSVLGEGGMGIVYEGEQQMGSKVRRVAIKTLHSHLSNDASVLARFHRECGTVSALEHPNTIKFYDFGTEDDGTLYIAMEFIDGIGIDKVIQNEGTFSPARVAKIMEQICGALDEAHDQGVIHRDLKPENIVLTERLGKKDFVKVLDFGIAARTESADAQAEAKLTQQGMVLGTPPYMSPEQFTGVELDRRSDVYSLGCMAYEMLTAQLPFTADTPWQWATQHMTATPFPIDQAPSGGAVPPQMRKAVMRALEKDPNDRPPTAGEFLAELETGLAGQQGLIAAATEEMQAMPSLADSRGSSVTPSPAVGVSAATSTQSEMSATQQFVVPTEKSKAGPVLLGVLVVGLLAGGVALFSGSPNAEVSDAASEEARGGVDQSPSTEKAAAARAEPEGKVGPEASSRAELDQNVEIPKANKKAGDSGSHKSPVPSTPSTPTRTGSSTASKVTKPKVVPPAEPAPATPSAECGKCIRLVSSGRLSAAANMWAACSGDPTARSKCSSKARSLARSQVAAEIATGRCAQAKSIEAIAARMKASSQRLRASVRNCKSK